MSKRFWEHNKNENENENSPSSSQMQFICLKEGVELEVEEGRAGPWTGGVSRQVTLHPGGLFDLPSTGD